MPAEGEKTRQSKEMPYIRMESHTTNHNQFEITIVLCKFTLTKLQFLLKF